MGSLPAADSFSGPIGVRLPQSTGLNYGEILQEQTLELRNQSGQSLSVMVRPLASMTVPIWRDKIAAGIARARARDLAARARLTQEEVTLTVMVAEKVGLGTKAFGFSRGFSRLREERTPMGLASRAVG